MSSASQHTQIGGFTLLGPKEATELDVDLMSSEGGFSLDQLMELAGLSVASAYATVYPLSSHPRVLIIAGPGWVNLSIYTLICNG
jgi:NAD(P)H-hydrate epimerase